MNTPVDLIQPGQQPASSGNKPLWAAVGVLSVAVLAMGGAMIYNQRAPAPAPTVAALSAPQAAPVPQLAAPAASANAADDLIEKPAAAPAKPAPAPAKKWSNPCPDRHPHRAIRVSHLRHLLIPPLRLLWRQRRCAPCVGWSSR
ncbi:hypothetical protein LP417_13020 [Polaromonas sp. P1-6]|nr:hypothetical protein LP417_13020 [Polaromonas sp. P1-6]